MNLFNRLLLYLFPESITNHPVNPGNIFVSFVAPKRFFSVINRKIVENYKLNLFDIGLDSFEVKIGFGDNPGMKRNDVDSYFAYCVAANFNGYKFFSPSHLAVPVSIVAAVIAKQSFEKANSEYYEGFMLTVYLSSFMFLSRIKVFPVGEKKERFNWFVQLFFSFYELNLEQQKVSIDKKQFEQIRQNLSKELGLLSFLYYFYQRLNEIFADKDLSDLDYYNWLFYDELKTGYYKVVLQDYLNNYKAYVHNASFSVSEKKVLQMILPVDNSIKHFFHGDLHMVVDHLFTKIYDLDYVHISIQGFLKNDSKMQEFLEYISDYRLFKKEFFEGIKNLSMFKFRDLGTKAEELLESEDNFSSIGGVDGPDTLKVPEKFKQESILIERMINFYVEYVGGSWEAKSDSFYMRLFRKDLIDEIVKFTKLGNLKQDVLFYYGALLYTYTKNVFYYKYAYDNVRAGKEKFNLPFRSTFKEVYSNVYILKLFDESFLIGLLQDINPRDIKIYLHNKDVIALFRENFGEDIAALLQLPDEVFVQTIYSGVANMLDTNKQFLATLSDKLTKRDIQNIKENLYALDFWIWIDFFEALSKQEVDFHQKYSDFSLMGIMSTLRDTLFGFMIYHCFIIQHQKAHNAETSIDTLWKIYIFDVLGITQDYYFVFEDVLNWLYEEYKLYIEKFIGLDENELYLRIGLNNWLSYVEGKTDYQTIAELAGEDLVWFRGYLKNITYYNKRYLIPKE